MIDVVRRMPHPRYLLSNTDATHIAWIRRRFPEVFPLFDGWVLSFEVGAEKPEEAIYQQVEALSGRPPESHIFVDDVPEFVAAAQARGWRGIRYTDLEQCALALRAADFPSS